MRSKKRESKNLGVGIIFIAVVFIVIVISLIFKVLDLYQKSEYDGKTNFYIGVMSEDNSQFISLSPADESIQIIDIEGDSEQMKSLGLPADIVVDSEKSVTVENVTSYLRSLVVRNGLNPFDSLRIILFLSSIPKDQIMHETFDPTSLEEASSLPSLLADPSITSENLTIEIINASGASGIGSRLANVVSNVGGSVLLVTSDSEEMGKSEMLISKPSNTSKKLEKLLGIKTVVQDNTGLSDIKIIIGKDLIGKL